MTRRTAEDFDKLVEMAKEHNTSPKQYGGEEVPSCRIVAMTCPHYAPRAPMLGDYSCTSWRPAKFHYPGHCKHPAIIRPTCTEGVEND